MSPDPSKFTRVKRAAIAQYCDDNHPWFVPVDVAIDLDMAAGKPILAAEMAALSGYALVPLPHYPNPRSFSDLMPLIAEAQAKVFAAYFRLQSFPATPGPESLELKYELKDTLVLVREFYGEALAWLRSLDER